MYGIGDGKFIFKDKLYCLFLFDLLSFIGVICFYLSVFIFVKERCIKVLVWDLDLLVNIEEEDSNVVIFSCFEEGCVKIFVRYLLM